MKFGVKDLAVQGADDEEDVEAHSNDFELESTSLTLLLGSELFALPASPKEKLQFTCVAPVEKRRLEEFAAATYRLDTGTTDSTEFTIARRPSFHMISNFDFYTCTLT
jgi:hypothetical protein